MYQKSEYGTPRNQMRYEYWDLFCFSCPNSTNGELAMVYIRTEIIIKNENMMPLTNDCLLPRAC